MAGSLSPQEIASIVPFLRGEAVGLLRSMCRCMGRHLQRHTTAVSRILRDCIEKGNEREDPSMMSGGGSSWRFGVGNYDRPAAASSWSVRVLAHESAAEFVQCLGPSALESLVVPLVDLALTDLRTVEYECRAFSEEMEGSRGNDGSSASGGGGGKRKRRRRGGAGAGDAGDGDVGGVGGAGITHFNSVGPSSTVGASTQWASMPGAAWAEPHAFHRETDHHLRGGSVLERLAIAAARLVYTALATCGPALPMEQRDEIHALVLRWLTVQQATGFQHCAAGRGQQGASLLPSLVSACAGLRVGLYQVLMTSALASTRGAEDSSSPVLGQAIALLTAGRADPNPEVSMLCQVALNACEVQLHPRAAPLVPSVACSTLHLPDPVAVVLVTAAAPIAIGAAGGMGLGVGNAANGVNAFGGVGSGSAREMAESGETKSAGGRGTKRGLAEEDEVEEGDDEAVAEAATGSGSAQEVRSWYGCRLWSNGGEGGATGGERKDGGGAPWAMCNSLVDV